MSNKWFFTYHQNDDNLRELFRNNLTLENKNGNIKFAAGQDEDAATSRGANEPPRVHIQGMVMFKQNYTMAKVKQLLRSESVHLEPMRGTIQQCLAYVHKDDTSVGNRFIIGERPKQGNESKWTALKAKIDTGASTQQLWLADDTTTTMTHYHKQEEIYRRMKAQNEAVSQPRAILYIWGPSGCGKTSLAFDYCRNQPTTILAIPKQGNYSDFFHEYCAQER